MPNSFRPNRIVIFVFFCLQLGDYTTFNPPEVRRQYGVEISDKLLNNKYNNERKNIVKRFTQFSMFGEAFVFACWINPRHLDDAYSQGLNVWWSHHFENDRMAFVVEWLKRGLSMAVETVRDIGVFMFLFLLFFIFFVLFYFSERIFYDCYKMVLVEINLNFQPGRR